MRSALLPLLLALAAGCTRPLDEPITPVDDGKAAPAAPAPAPASAPASADLDPKFVPLVASAFREYKAWGRVDDEMRWAPWLCRMPLPGRARMSIAEDGEHAQKLYSVFAKQHDPYPLVANAPVTPQPVGQVLVKESWHPEPVEKAAPGAEMGLSDRPSEDHFNPYARHGDRIYRASRIAGAYVVAKVAPETAGTDAGWVYGTVTPDGVVTSAGRVASCMGCHVSARHERVFGLAPSAAVNAPPP